MKTVRTGRWLFLTALLAAVAYMAMRGSGISPASAADTKVRPKKTSTGQTFVEQTVVDAAPAPAAPPSGFDTERVMSGQDDWEPANAVDPINPNLVYQLTTRYSGPTA